MNDTMTSNGVTSAEEAEAAELRALDAELAAATRARDEAQRKLEPTKRDAKLAAIAQAKREAAHAEIVAQLVEKYGPLNVKIATYETPAGLVAVKCPDMPNYCNFYEKLRGDKGATVAETDLFVRRCLIYPTIEEYQTLRDSLPGVPAVMMGLALKLAGTKVVDLEGK